MRLDKQLCKPICFFAVVCIFLYILLSVIKYPLIVLIALGLTYYIFFHDSANSSILATILSIVREKTSLL